jgi:hypothetical protein
MTANNLTVADLREAAARHGATVEDASLADYVAYRVCAPSGKCWDEGLHVFRVEWRAGDAAAEQEALRDVLAQMEDYGGLSDCTVPDCPYCQGEDDDDLDPDVGLTREELLDRLRSQERPATPPGDTP